MNKYIDINELKEEITDDDIYNILDYLEAEPRFEGNYITALSICHSSESRKLFYYLDSKLFYCFIEDKSFDLFGLLQKLLVDCGNEGFYKELLGIEQPNLADLLRWVDRFCGLGCGQVSKRDLKKAHRKPIASTDLRNIPSVQVETFEVNLSHYPKPLVKPWIEEGISQKVCNEFGVCYDPVQGSILIPHYTREGKIAGIKQRTLLIDENKEPFFEFNGSTIKTKYLNYWHGIKLNKSTSLYGIHKHEGQKKAIIFESEKSVLKSYSMLQVNNYIPLATSGHSISREQAKILIDCGIQEITVAFDRDYRTTSDDEFEELLSCYGRIQELYGQYFEIYFIIDSFALLEKHDAPIDKGKKTFVKLFKNRTKY